MDKRHIGEVCEKSINGLRLWCGKLEKKLTKKEKEIAYRILKELNERILFLNNVGPEYLTRSR